MYILTVPAELRRLRPCIQPDRSVCILSTDWMIDSGSCKIVAVIPLPLQVER